MAEIAHALASIIGRIGAKSSGRSVRLVAVSKTKPVEDLMAAYEAGQRFFAFKVLELQEKSTKMPADTKWHFIGHLQSNKVKKLLETQNLAVIETVDSIKLAKEIHKYLEINKTSSFNATLPYPLPIFLQVKTSDEDSKSGVEPSDCLQLFKKISSDCPNLKVAGFMTIGKLHGDPKDDFQLLKETRNQLCKELNIPEDNMELSMGMSSDFETAIEYGSTSVRVGSSIFGARAPKNPNASQPSSSNAP